MAFNSTIGITTSAENVTASDTAIISYFYLYVGGTGNVVVQPFHQKDPANPKTVTFTSVPAGTYLRVMVSKVLSTGTTATNIVGFGPN